MKLVWFQIFAFYFPTVSLETKTLPSSVALILFVVLVCALKSSFGVWRRHRFSFSNWFSSSAGCLWAVFDLFSFAVTSETRPTVRQVISKSPFVFPHSLFPLLKTTLDSSSQLREVILSFASFSRGRVYREINRKLMKCDVKNDVFEYIKLIIYGVYVQVQIWGCKSFCETFVIAKNTVMKIKKQDCSSQLFSLIQKPSVLWW